MKIHYYESAFFYLENINLFLKIEHRFFSHAIHPGHSFPSSSTFHLPLAYLYLRSTTLYSLQKREDHQDTTAKKNKIRYNNPCHKKIYLEFQLKFWGKCTKSINHWQAAEHYPYFPFEEQLSFSSLLSSTHFSWSIISVLPQSFLAFIQAAQTSILFLKSSLIYKAQWQKLQHLSHKSLTKKLRMRQINLSSLEYIKDFYEIK